MSTEHMRLVEAEITSYFESSIAQATQIDASYQQLWEVMYGLIRSGGKRLRPRLTLLAYEAFGGKDTQAIVPVAAAQELLHFSLLVHDDIIDRDFVRYGSPNISGRYKTAYGHFIKDEAHATHYANAAAILGGDLMLAGAHELIGGSGLEGAQKSKALSLLSRSIFEVAGGELLDTESSFVPYSSGDALKIARYKSAGYSFVGPLVTGASLAGANAKQLAALRVYAVSLGVAYQLVDDILGVFGNEDETGKSTTGDIVEGKRTFMAEYALSHMNDSQTETFFKAFGNEHASQRDLQAVREL
ncbi:MAG TPA: polyprenyl synthetase family protein, partial [Verrucomicrobiae bacterium]|nr:polyprenyl synthetase family protein [Verrucomicrobiae bacterium]